MALTVRDSNLYVDLLQEAVEGAFAGKMALYGTGAVILKPGMPTTDPSTGASYDTGDTIGIPYWDTIGELDDLAEGAALVPRKLTSTKETASVQRSGIAGEVTSWAQMVAQAGDPYAEMARQFVKASMRRIDAGCLAVAQTTTLSYADAASITEDTIINASEKYGDELDDEDGIALVIMHPVQRKKARLLKDSNGNRLYKPSQTGPGGSRITLPTFADYPVLASSRVPVSGSTYTGFVVKKGAIAAWYAQMPIEADRDILAATDVTALHLYHTEHLYKRKPGGTVPGVVKFTTVES